MGPYVKAVLWVFLLPLCLAYIILFVPVATAVIAFFIGVVYPTVRTVEISDLLKYSEIARAGNDCIQWAQVRSACFGLLAMRSCF